MKPQKQMRLNTYESKFVEYFTMVKTLVATCPPFRILIKKLEWDRTFTFYNNGLDLIQIEEGESYR